MGYHVLINCMSNTAEAEKTLGLVRQAGQDGEVLQFDVSNRTQTRKVLEAWMEAHPEEYIEVLVNNAGIRRDNLMVFMPDEDWDSVLDTSLDGFYNVTQPLLQPMLRHKYGRIVSLASVSGLKGMPGQANYSAAKGGIIAATKALAQEVARKNVTVNAVAPGFIQTDMVEGLDQGGTAPHHPRPALRHARGGGTAWWASSPRPTRATSPATSSPSTAGFTRKPREEEGGNLWTRWKTSATSPCGSAR